MTDVAVLGDFNMIHVRRWFSVLAAEREVCVVGVSNQPLLEPHPGVILAPRRRGGVRGLLSRIGNTLRFRAYLKRSKPEVVHAHFLSYQLIEVLVVPTEIPIVGTVWGADIMPEERWRKRSALIVRTKERLHRRILGRFRVFTYHSEFLKRELISRIGVSDDRLRFLSFGVQVPEVSSPERCKAVRDRYGIPHRAKVILCPRQIAPVYNTISVVRALSKLEQGRFHLILKDYHSPQDRYLRLVHHEINVLGISESITIIPEVSEQELSELFSCSDVVVSVASHDGLSIAVLEAMSYEKPLVLSDIAANRLEFERTGNALVDPESPSDIAEMIRTMVTVETRKTIEANRAYVAKHERERNITTLIRIYQEVS